MMNFESLRNKEFAYSCLRQLIEKGCLNEEEIRILTNGEECKRKFNYSNYPILLELPYNSEFVDDYCYDEIGRQRFYKDKIVTNGRAFIVSNHWYGPNKSMPDNRTPFLRWVLEKIK